MPKEQSWSDAQQRVQEEIKNLPAHESFLAKQVTHEGRTVMYRDATELQTLLRITRTEATREDLSNGGYAAFIGECGPG
jgi:hypothetical protein